MTRLQAVTLALAGALILAAPPARAADAPAVPAPASSATPPASTPSADQPVNPFGQPPAGTPTAAWSGVVEFSDGRTVPGDLFATSGRDLEIFDRDQQKKRVVSLADLAAIETVVEWQRLDPEWRFKEPGSTEKIFTGKSYPNRKYHYILTLRAAASGAASPTGAPATAATAAKITADIMGQALYVQPTGCPRWLFVLHERQRGPTGADLAGLVYVKAVRFDADLRRAAELQLQAAGSAPAVGTPASAGAPPAAKSPASPSAANPAPTVAPAAPASAAPPPAAPPTSPVPGGQP